MLILAERIYTQTDEPELKGEDKRKQSKIVMELLDLCLPDEFASRLKAQVFYELSDEPISGSAVTAPLASLPAATLNLISDALYAKNEELKSLTLKLQLTAPSNLYSTATVVMANMPEAEPRKEGTRAPEK